MTMCTACHGTATFAGQRLSGAEWKSEVDSMVARGAKGSESQIRAVVEYLTRYLGKETK
jgi:mono/diheme cytochrome c family protein